MNCFPIKVNCWITQRWTFALLLVFAKGSLSQSPIHFENPAVCRNMPEFCHCNLTTITCDCAGKNLQLQEPMANNRNTITIINCDKLSIEPQSLYNSGPLKMTLQNIKDLNLTSLSFAIDVFQNPHIDLSLINTTVTKFPSNTFTADMFNARVLTGVDLSKAKKPVLQLLMKNTSINVIEARAFGNIIIESMSIINSTVATTQRIAINNPLGKLFEIVNTNFKNLSRDAIVLHKQASTTAKVIIDRNSFHENLPQFLSGTINGDVYITNNSFATFWESPWNLDILNEAFIKDNIFETIPKNGIHLWVKNRVTISKNTIGRLQGNALQWIIPKDHKTALFLTGNTIQNHEPMSLCLNEDFDGDFVVIKNNLFQQECTCNITNDIAESLGNGNLTIEILYEDKIHQQWLQHGKCIRKGSETAIDLFLVQKCLRNNRKAMVLMFVFSAILIIMAICVIAAWRRLKYKNFSQGSDSEYHSFSAPAPPSSGQTPWSLVQPDSRTYQETEIHVLFDKAKEIEDTDDYLTEKESSGMNVNSSSPSSNPSVMKAHQSADSNVEKGSKADNGQTQPSLVRQSCPILP